MQILNITVTQSQLEMKGCYLRTQHMEKAGLGSSVILFMRPKAVDMWKVLESEEKMIEIERSPRIGKSALVWAWASWEVTKEGKRIIWMHFNKLRLVMQCGKIRGEKWKAYDSCLQNAANYFNQSDEEWDVIILRRCAEFMGCTQIMPAKIVCVTLAGLLIPCEQNNFK